MEPPNLPHPGINGASSSRNIYNPQAPPAHRTGNGNSHVHMPVSGGNHANGAPQGLEHLHAAEVLASFQQYPIRATAKNGSTHSPPQTPFGNSSLPSRQHLHGHPRPTAVSYQHDPLLQDMQAHSRDLGETLLPILGTPDGAPGTNYELNNCQGVRGIGGAMVTLPGTDGIPTDPAVQRFQYVTPSPTAASLDGSGMRHEIYAEPTLVTPQSESKPVKQEKEEFKTTFQFVVNEDAKEARNTVRKHVMREYRRRERWEQGQRGPPEKKPAVPAPKKRRRKQVRSPEEEGQSAIQEMPPEILPDAPPVEQRNDPGAQKDEEGKSQGSSGGGAKSPGSSGSENQPAPTKKKLRVVSPIFPESKQHQLWGAVATDYDDAIAELEGNKITPYTADPWAGVAVNEIDPFSKLKLELGPATSSLLHHFAWVMPSLMDEIVTGKVFHRLGWLYSAVAIHDPTPVHVILGYTLGHIASLRGIEEPALAIEHKSKAIKLLHARMSDPTQCYSDGLIGAIVNFAGWELICANPKAYAMHMSGLARIIAARGGMSALADNPELETVIIRLDAIRAYVAISAPRYPAFTSVRALSPLAINIPASPRSTWSPSSPFTPFEYRYCSEVLSLLNMLEDILLLARSAATDLTGPVGVPFKKLLSSSLSCILERSSSASPSDSLSSPSSSTGSSNNPGYNNTDLYASLSSPTMHPNSPHYTPDERRLYLASKSLRLAALAFLDAAIREFFDAPPQPGYYTKRLQYRFLGSKALANDSPWGRSLEMVIAVLLQADRMALERPWRAWYVADALTLTMRIGEVTWDMVAGALSRWILEGGLDADEALIAEDRERGLDDGSEDVAGGYKSGSRDGDGDGGSRKDVGQEGETAEKIKKRSSDVWDLRKVAQRFVQEWDRDVPMPEQQQMGGGVDLTGMSSSGMMSSGVPAIANPRGGVSGGMRIPRMSGVSSG